MPKSRGHAGRDVMLYQDASTLSRHSTTTPLVGYVLKAEIAVYAKSRLVQRRRVGYSHKFWKAATGRPKVFRNFQWVDRRLRPPAALVSRSVVVAVVCPTKRDRKFVTCFATQRAGLSKPKMMRIRGRSRADETGLCCHEAQMDFVTMTARLADCQHALVDLR